MSRGPSAADAARYGVRPLTPGPLEALRQAVLDTGAGPEALPALARHAACEAFWVAGLTSDQVRVLERELRRLGGEVVAGADGDRAVLMGPLLAFGELPTRLAEWSDSAAGLGAAIAQALAGKGAPAGAWRLGGGRTLDCSGRTLVMGIVNVTPDSFSGDATPGVPEAVARGEAMAAEGADIIDVGGESTRPHSQPVAADEERRRVLPVVAELSRRVPVPVSIDTRKAEVAAAAVEAGAVVVNDIWGLRRDPDMAGVCAQTGAGVVLMHNAEEVTPGDVVAAAAQGLRESLRLAEDAGIDASATVVDPGLGFAKTPAQNLEVLRRLGELRGIGRPILVGASRKSTIGMLLDGAPADQRLEGSLALAVLAAAAGASLVRAHDVAATVRALRVAGAVLQGTPPALRDLPAPGPTQ